MKRIYINKFVLPVPPSRSAVPGTKFAFKTTTVESLGICRRQTVVLPDFGLHFVPMRWTLACRPFNRWPHWCCFCLGNFFRRWIISKRNYNVFILRVTHCPIQWATYLHSCSHCRCEVSDFEEKIYFFRNDLNFNLLVDSRRQLNRIEPTSVLFSRNLCSMFLFCL